MALSSLFTESEITDLSQSIGYSFHNHHHSFLILIIPVWPFYSHYCSLFSLDLFLPFSSSENISNDSLSKRLDPEPRQVYWMIRLLVAINPAQKQRPRVPGPTTRNTTNALSIPTGILLHATDTAREEPEPSVQKHRKAQFREGPIGQPTTVCKIWKIAILLVFFFLLSPTLHQQEPRTGCCQQVIQCFVHSIDNLP